MIGDRNPGRFQIKNAHGFTMVELMVVMAIVAILATGVVFMFANPSAKSKNQAFTMLGELNMARSEAVSENQDVLIIFLFGTQDGYQICFDSDGDGLCADETGDNFIRETTFQRDVQYYDPTVLPTDGPATTSGGGDLIGGTGIVLDDDTTLTSFSMESDGTLEDGISQAVNVVVYVPKDSHNEIYGTPYTIKISPNTGRIILERWTEAGVWGRK